MHYQKRLFKFNTPGRRCRKWKIYRSMPTFINIARHFQLISEMSVNDLATLGHSIGFSPTLDNPKSAKYQPTFATVAGGVWKWIF
jgi:hypothetical protein